MINIFSELKKVNYQLSNALSTMFLRRLDIFLRFDTYVFENPQKEASTDFPIHQLHFLPHIAEVTNQVTPPDWIVYFFDFLNYMNDF